MSKYSDDFEATFPSTKKIREVTAELKRIEEGKAMDRRISEVLAGKWVRRAKK
jgi:hypothetical protein